ncbi:hydroxymethylpyrimidine/phosphomethylpyrimidine kinase [Aliiroseovarius sp. KMU-50]|uniref:hydroxymethylpyrimidine kinase n=1 Tax=Aliiroseovarius salicola TaxID=3009082 RepID=A0ABT4VZI4_9RHOB|nr:hydroxymethylpyrimidine/phosphomethylpyrimidine kinase [Aliiroseovarius sp. KMU-50]MDA5093674.1 hydroxymethylpyrimidine/phosphomethylpyrimidine kinase [Aliiroseovarius sp. KMU-50]
MNANRILVIAGTDSSGGAGLTRDTAVANEMGCDVLPVVTAVTAQTHSNMTGVRPMSASFVMQQLDAALASGTFKAIKIGMLGTPDIAECVAEWLERRSMPTVIDPVLKTSSGWNLNSGILPQRLLAQADLLTPNLPEAAALTGRPVATTHAQVTDQASEILSGGPDAVLIKGGHGNGANSLDHLFGRSGHQTFSAPRVINGKRGTGCTLATAIACQLALGCDLIQACQSAKEFVHTWLSAPSDASPSRRAQPLFAPQDHLSDHL